MEQHTAAVAPRATSPTAIAELIAALRTAPRARATGLRGASRGYALAHLAREATQDRDEVAAKVVAAGYAKGPVGEDAGPFAGRRGVFGVWSAVDGQPGRIEFFGDTVESLRSFDPQTERSIGELREVSL